MSRTIDLNLDAGESAEALKDGREAALYGFVSSVNIACGGHAGDHDTMNRAMELAQARGLRIGAHPSYPDREGFGRRVWTGDPAALRDSVCDQIEVLRTVARQHGVRLMHVKPHGALYNIAADDENAAAVLISAVQRVDRALILVGRAGSKLLKRAREAGLTAEAEAFTDRRYEPDGSLRSRQHADALISEPLLAAEQAVRLAREGRVTAVNGQAITLAAQTLCIHGDTPHALAIASAVHAALKQAGIRIQA